MKIQTGQGTIPLFTLFAVWSVSMVTSLPGLAVTPILGDLKSIFPGTSETAIEMLSAMPNLLIIPFVLLSGKISESKGKLPILIAGLFIFLISAILYFLAKSMVTLILISCLLGIGAGMITPLSTGLIADIFSGEYRTEQLGLSSSITNLTLVLATVLTGWLATKNWHYPFLVYLLPILVLALVNFLRPPYLKNNMNQTTAEESADNLQVATRYIKAGKSMNMHLLWGLMILYFLSTYTSIMITFNLSFVMESYHMSSDYSGILISIYFLALMIPGFLITKLIKLMKNYMIFIGFLMIAVGLLVIALFKTVFLIGFGAVITGFGYGMIQPLIYDKTVLVARPKKSVVALALVMSMNYLAIVLVPFIIDLFEIIFHQKGVLFPFYLNMVMSGIVAVFAYFFRGKTLFSGESSMG